jgi:flagellar protein FliO/FliZ
VRIALALLAAVALSSPRIAADSPAASGPIIYPGTPPATDSRRPEGTGYSVTAAIFITGCAAAGVWLWLRGRKGGPGPSVRGERKLSIAETRPLGNRQYLIVAAYEGKKYLLSVCPGRIDLLAPLEPPGPPAT